MESYDIFISYTQQDGDLAAEIATRLDDGGMKCFMADRSILAASEWEPTLRSTLCASARVLLLLTPRSKNSLWVAAEAGAAWALSKQLIPVLLGVDVNEVFEPIRKFQVRRYETDKQKQAFIREILGFLDSGRESKILDQTRPSGGLGHHSEDFTMPRNWAELLKVGQWTRDERFGSITGEGMNRYLLSHHCYVADSLTIRSRLRFLELRPQSFIDAVNRGNHFWLGHTR